MYGYDDSLAERASDRVVWDDLRDFVRQLRDYLRGNSKSLRETFIALILSIVTDVFTGLILGRITEALVLLPGLLVLIPAAINMRGSILAALGSRLGSSMHMGSLTKISLRESRIHDNIFAALSQTIMFSVMLGAAAHVVLIAVGFASIGLIDLVLIAFIGGLASTAILLVVALAMAYFSYKRSWDLDNIQAPIITALGDLVTVPAMLLAIFLLPPGSAITTMAFIAVLVVLLITIIATWRAKSAYFRAIIYQSLAVLAITTLLEIGFAGLVLEQSLAGLVAIPLFLVIIPVFLEEGGNIGNTLASRLATRMHLGELEMKLSDIRKLRNEIINSYILAAIVFPLAAVMTFGAALVFAIGGISFLNFVWLTFATGLVLTTIVIGVSIAISFLAYRFNVDPDNVTIPVVTTVADVLGVLVFIGVLSATGVI